MDFQAVLLVVGGVEDLDLGKFEGAGNRLLVHPHLAQRGGEGIVAADRQPPNRNPVAGPQQQHTGDPFAGRFDPGVSGGGNLSGIDVTGMGGDNRLGYRVVCRIDLGQVAPDRGFEVPCPTGVERACHCRLPDRSHGSISPCSLCK